MKRVFSTPLQALLLASTVALVFVAPVLMHATPPPVTSVHLALATAPSAGVAGVSNVNLTGSGFLAGTYTPANIQVTFATTCGGAVVATAPATSIVTVLGSTRRIQVVIPGTLASGTYFVKASDSVGGDTPFDSGTSCSQVNVTHTSAALAACVPTSSLGISAPVNPGPVTAIVPNGSWGGATTGFRLVNVEGAGVNSSVATPQVVNSCAANSATGQAVCVSNLTNVYLINSNGSGPLTTLNSSSNSSGSFSGGSCRNCGVAVNALTNQAVIAMGLTPSPSGDGVQLLDLNTNTFSAARGLTHDVSEDISIDPTRGFVLSPNENGFYDILGFNSSTGAFTTEFTRDISSFGLGVDLDSAAEDCTTGIALTVGEFTSNVFLADLTQATFTAGTPGTWTSPAKGVNLNALDPDVSFAAGASAVTVAPGTSHLAIVTGEFGGSSFAVLQLPSTSGTGTPDILDFAFVRGICGVSSGFDPHTISAYTSPNDGRAYSIMADWATGLPARLAVIDLAAVMAAPRTNAHTVNGAFAGDAICNTTDPNLVRFISTAPTPVVPAPLSLLTRPSHRR